MNIREVSSQFSIYVTHPDLDVGAQIKVALAQAGYDAYYLQNQNDLIQRLEDTPPHLVVFSANGLEGSLNHFVEKVNSISGEIRMICLADFGQFDVLAQYKEYGFVDILSDDKQFLAEKVLWATDKACEGLYYLYQNEQLFADYKNVRQDLDVLQKAQPKKAKVHSAFDRITDYKSADSKESLVQKYLQRSESTPMVFFKFLTSVRSFVVTQSVHMDVERIQGLGAQLSPGELKDLSAQLSVGLLPPSLLKMVNEAVHLQEFRVWPLYVHHQLEGVVICQVGEETTDLHEEFSLFGVMYSHFTLEKKVDSLEVQDFVTEVYNRRYYLKALEEEVNRARRTRTALSVVKVSIDDFYELEQSLGEAGRDQVLKTLAALIVKSSRTNDVTCRTQMNELAMLLPNCDRKGAALRAERLRRIVESAHLVERGVRVSISLGVSEFPGLCKDAGSLDETATKALAHIIDKGGNKICLYKAPEGHQPEYEVRPIEVNS